MKRLLSALILVAALLLPNSKMQAADFVLTVVGNAKGTDPYHYFEVFFSYSVKTGSGNEVKKVEKRLEINRDGGTKTIALTSGSDVIVGDVLVYGTAHGCNIMYNGREYTKSDIRAMSFYGGIPAYARKIIFGGSTATQPSPNVYIDGKSPCFEATKAINRKYEANDLKPGDFVIWNASKSRYEALDGGYRNKNRNIGRDASSFKSQVIGIVAAVLDELPSGATGCKGIYTADGKMHHALVIDLKDCERKWEYSSDNDDPAIGSEIWSNDRHGYSMTTAFFAYNDRRGASHRIKPIHWIVARNSSNKLPGGTTGWYLPSVYEMERTTLQPVNASLSALIKAGRTDVGRIQLESDYWTCDYDRNHNNKAFVWNFVDVPYYHNVETYVRKKQAELFVRAVFAL